MCLRWFGLAAAAAALICPALVRAAEPYWPNDLMIGTASPGGTYYDYGEGLARILTRTLGLPVARLTTEGPAQNIALLEAGEAKLGFVTTGMALQAWNGTGIWAGKRPAHSMRVVFPMYDTPFQLLVLQSSGLHAVSEMGFKRVGVGPHSGTSATYVPEFFNTLQVPVQFMFGEWEELAGQMQRRELDVIAGAGGVPLPAFIELEAKEKVRYIPFTSEQVAVLRLAMPELTPSLIPAGSYPSLLRNYQTVGLYNFAVAHELLPDDLVYTIVRSVFEHHQEMMEAHSAAAATIPANMDHNSFLPVHPGAIRYYRKLGKAGQTD